jgi:ATP-binding protein involved in chromosome partitioning
MAHGVKIISMGFLSGPNTPVIWRGPMVHGLLQQFLKDVEWGTLDYLVIDLPPGGRCAALHLAGHHALRRGHRHHAAGRELLDARKGLLMFRQLRVPVLGIVENMSYFLCPHCGERTEIFRHGGGKKASEELGCPVPRRRSRSIPRSRRAATEASDRRRASRIARGQGLCGVRKAGRGPALGPGGVGGGEATARADHAWADRVEIERQAMAVEVAPTQIRQSGPRELEITWTDGHVSTYPVTYLRRSCRCASCIDEWTGQQILRPDQVSENVKPLRIDPVGRYALHIASVGRPHERHLHVRPPPQHLPVPGLCRRPGAAQS